MDGKERTAHDPKQTTSSAEHGDVALPVKPDRSSLLMK